jgi:hypothetical protein
LKELTLSFSNELATANLDSCLGAIFGLDQISNLFLCWNRLSVDLVKSSLIQQGTNKRLTKVYLTGIDRLLFDSDVLEICAFLPHLQEWLGFCPSSPLSTQGVRDWKRICPDLATVKLAGISEDVEEELEGMGVSVSRID